MVPEGQVRLDYEEMKANFRPRGAVTGVGSLSFKDPERALDLVFECCPELPFWPQLPRRGPQEGMIRQAGGRPDLAPESNAGFFAALERIGKDGGSRYFKGQIVGPWTLVLHTRSPKGEAALKDNHLTHHLIRNLRGQVAQMIREMHARGLRPVIVLDEPGLAALGKDNFRVPKGRILEVWREFFTEARGMGALIGLHSCARENLDLFIASGADLVSFDAFHDLDAFLLVGARPLTRFLEGGGSLALGIVPTSDFNTSPGAQGLAQKVEAGLDTMGRLGMDSKQVFDRLLITPSCGLALLDEATNVVIFKTCREVSEILRRRFSR